MNVPAFIYRRARSLEEACDILAGLGDEAKVLAGGTDLLVKMKHRRLTPSYLVDLKHVPELDYIRHEHGEGLRIGALTTIESVKRSPVVRKSYPLLHQASAYLATVAIRNRATVVGNICNGSPSAEMAPALIALGTTARVVGPDGERTVPVEKFFTGPGSTVLGPDEIVAELQVPNPPAASAGVYEKYSLRRMDVAMVGVAVLVVPAADVCGDIKIVLSAVAPTPIRATGAEDILRGRAPNADLIGEAARAAAAAARPITDIRGTAQARREITETLTKQVVDRAMRAAKLGVG